MGIVWLAVDQLTDYPGSLFSPYSFFFLSLTQESETRNQKSDIRNGTK